MADTERSLTESYVEGLVIRKMLLLWFCLVVGVVCVCLFLCLSSSITYRFFAKTIDFGQWPNAFLDVISKNLPEVVLRTSSTHNHHGHSVTFEENLRRRIPKRWLMIRARFTFCASASSSSLSGNIYIYIYSHSNATYLCPCNMGMMERSIWHVPYGLRSKEREGERDRERDREKEGDRERKIDR